MTGLFEFPGARKSPIEAMLAITPNAAKTMFRTPKTVIHAGRFISYGSFGSGFEWLIDNARCGWRAIDHCEIAFVNSAVVGMRVEHATTPCRGEVKDYRFFHGRGRVAAILRQRKVRRAAGSSKRDDIIYSKIVSAESVSGFQ